MTYLKFAISPASKRRVLARRGEEPPPPGSPTSSAADTRGRAPRGAGLPGPCCKAPGEPARLGTARLGMAQPAPSWPSCPGAAPSPPRCRVPPPVPGRPPGAAPTGAAWARCPLGAAHAEGFSPGLAQAGAVPSIKAVLMGPRGPCDAWGRVAEVGGLWFKPLRGGMKIQFKDSPSVTTRYHPLGPINL